jgi:hypothetical protein
MKRLLATAILATVAVVGCDKGTPGGPGATGAHSGTGASRSTGTGIGTADNTFTLSPPLTGVSIEQGETKTVDIGIKRGTGFDQDVSLKLDNLPKGVTADPSSPMIKKGDTEAKITLKAAADAAIGDAKVHVVGKPGTGAEASNDFTVTVKKK